MEKYNASGSMEVDQKLLEEYGKIDNFRELYSKLSSISDSYEDFVRGVIRYAATNIFRKEKVIYSLSGQHNSRRKENRVTNSHPNGNEIR